MSDATTAPATATADGAPSTPAQPTPAPTLADVRAARRAGQQPAASEQKPADAPADKTEPATEAKTEPVQIDMDEKQLTQFTTLNRELRASKAKTKELEEKIASFSVYERAQQLAKDGKHYEAARAAGIDVDAALAELLGQQQTPEQTELSKLQKEVEELRRAREDEVKTKDEATKAEEAAAIERGKARVVEYVAKEAAKYPFLSKSPDLVTAALKDADDAYTKIKAKLPEGEELSHEEKNKILFDALEIHEEKWAKTFGAKTEKAEEKKVPGFDSSLRGNVRESAPATKKHMTLDEVKAARRAAARAK